ncbi:MAG: insulinase family protein [Rikenellaceae bacterium]|nr:insulinase family protein [Rikenellaceae bacterium]
MKKFTLWIVAVLISFSAAAQGMNPMQPIPEDAAVRKGTLENGMTYYIRHNEKPKNQADFYILHHVGAIQEETDQQGLAHFLEHMAFNGTKNMPGKQVIEYLETVGVKFGVNLNAYTSWDETCYNISDVPTTREGIIDSAMLILHDWSHFIALQPKEIDSERGVIQEELRTRDNASWRSTMKMLQALGKGTRYAERNLIGYLEGLKSFDHSSLENFYQTWYRPDYQAVVIVGDVDVDQIEAKLKTLMSDIPAPAADAVKKEVIVVPDNEEPIISIYTDPEMQSSQAQIFMKYPALPKEANNTIYAEMLAIMQHFFASMAGERLQEIAMKPNAPFLGGQIATGSTIGIIPTLNATVAAVSTKDGGLAKGYEAIMTEVERIRRHGFTYGEFERAQNDLMRSAERGYANRNDQTNRYYVNRYLAAYRSNAAMPDAETEWKLDSMLIKSLNVEVINQLAKQVIMDKNQVIIINSPEKEGVAVPTEEEILAIRKKVAESEIAPYEDNVVKEPLIAEGTVLKGSPVKKTAIDENYGTTTWTLKNGIEIVVKPTTFKADEVQIRASADGGFSVLTNEEIAIADLIPTICQMSGVGKFSRVELQKQLSGIAAQVAPSAGTYSSNMIGMGSPKDIETILQLMYLQFTQPRFNEDDYNTVMNLVGAQVANLENNPDYLMQKKTTEIAYGNNPRRQEITKEVLAKYSFEKMEPIYRKLFPNGNSFRFYVVGNVDLETLKPLVEKYIGSLPTDKKNKMEAVDDKADYLPGMIDETFRTEMQQPKVSVAYIFSGETQNTLKNRLAMNFLSQALNSRYLVSIREEKGGTYGVGVGGSVGRLPNPRYTLRIQFDTNDQMADELCEIVIKEIEEIAANGPKSEDVEKTREYLLKEWQNGLEQNASWMNYMTLKWEADLDYVANYEEAVKSLTNADIQAMAKMILEKKNQIKIMMRPEAAAE